MTYDQLEACIIAWAQAESAVRAVIAIGSRARGNPDQWSDLDLLIFMSERERYAADPSWLSAFGVVVLTYLEDTPAHNPEWFVLYEGDLKLDAVLMPVEDAALDLDTLLTPFADWHALQRGAEVWFDRLGERRPLPVTPFAPPEPPSAAALVHVVSGFLVESVTAAKLVARGDLWRAQFWFWNDLRRHLLTLIEWHAQGRDTWYNGRFIDQWADPRVLAALPDTFALYERDSMSRALLAMLDLLRWLGEEIAARLGYAYPIHQHEQVVELIHAILEQPR